MTSCRLLIDGPAKGAWNMALDEALLLSAQRDGQTSLRFYRWSEPTVSLGYFQPHAQRQQHRGSLRCPAVRRLTGGGAIVHDQELTYSFTAPAASHSRVNALNLYRTFHQALIDALAPLGVSARLWEEARRLPPEREPFLCFQRCGAGDVLLEQVKIAGSAQRRRRGAILQHGSVLLGKSTAAHELPGIAEAAGVRIDVDDLQLRWTAQLASRLDIEFSQQVASAQEIDCADSLCQQRFEQPNWTRRR